MPIPQSKSARQGVLGEIRTATVAVDIGIKLGGAMKQGMIPLL
jgi:hypothetical protein